MGKKRLWISRKFAIVELHDAWQIAWTQEGVFLFRLESHLEELLQCSLYYGSKIFDLGIAN